MFLKNKKGAEDIVLPMIIFLVLNLAFFGALLYFVYGSSTGALVYEESYAKQIALLIDSAEPSSLISIDFEKGFEIAKDNGIKDMKEVIHISGNLVSVRLGTGAQGHSYSFFSDYEIGSYPQEDKNIYTITVNEKAVEQGGENVAE